MIIYTIGFTKITAEDFFGRLKTARVKSLIDVRLKADSQLSGFAKKRDLPFFLRELNGSSYQHEMALAPTLEMLDLYKKGGIRWSEYAELYTGLIRERRIESLFKPADVDGSCFLCSEDSAHHCHRRLAAEYLRECWSETLEIVHL